MRKRSGATAGPDNHNHMRQKQKTIVFLGDGMADEPVPELGGLTPLQYARTPAMDSIARDGCSGTLLTLPAGFPTGSEVANMSVLGCDLASEYGGRGPLEAAGRGIALGPDDVAFRLNLTTVGDGRLMDFAGGHLDQPSADELIRALNNAFGSDAVRFHGGLSYRNLLVFHGAGYSARVRTEKPDDNHGERVADHLALALEPAAEPTAALLRRLTLEAGPVLEACPANRSRALAGKPMANGIWPSSGGCRGSLRKFEDKYGVFGAVISAVDIINGLGRCLGLDVIPVSGATGYLDTNYEGKADAAIQALATRDFVYLHLEAIDEVSHEQNTRDKLRAIEAFDSRIVARVLAAMGRDLNVAVLPDHPVPVRTGKHTRTPVPVAVRMSGLNPDSALTFDEIACARGCLGAMKNGDLMSLLFGRPRSA
ncbi:MAG: cofactor-independent phosphoglycerate mutase [Verrucomicrobiota bacterium]|nr:cofactor-independent phosphoglycerate mutase [Verrucomicrobiota bacterium]